MADGKIEWGGGSGGRDTSLYRSAANTLQTDSSIVLNGSGSNLTVGGALSLAGTSTLTGNVAIGTTVNSNRALNVIRASTDPTATQHSIYSELNVAQTAANAQTAAALGGTLTVSGTGNNTGQLASLQSSTNYDSTGLGSDVISATITARQNTSGGGVTALRGLFVRVENNSTSNPVNTAYGIDVAQPTIAAGTIANYRGIRIVAPTSNVTGTNYGLQIDTPGGTGTNAAINLSGTGGAAASGILFGTDTNLYRSAAGTLKMDDQLVVGQTLNVLSGSLTVTGTSSTNAEIGFSANIRGKNESLTASATSLAITGKTYSDASYATLCTPNWNTTCWVSSKTATGFTLNFGTAAPASATVDWLVAR